MRDGAVGDESGVARTRREAGSRASVGAGRESDGVVTWRSRSSCELVATDAFRRRFELLHRCRSGVGNDCYCYCVKTDDLGALGF